LFGLHPNAELDFRITQSNSLFGNLIDMEPKDSSGGGGDESEQSKLERIKSYCDVSIMNKIADGFFNIPNLLQASGEDRGPFANVFIQECELMKNLCNMIKKNVNDIKDAIDGKLTMTELIEKNIEFISNEKVPIKWINDGFSTNRKLTTWLTSIELRIQQYKIFETENAPPKIVFVNRLFNALSYLTAIRQTFAQKSNMELDKLIIITEPTNIDLRNQKEAPTLPKDGVLVYGFHLQGARWDEENRIIDESKPREDFCVMPVINCKTEDTGKVKLDDKTIYVCPVYRTIDRQNTFVFAAQFKTKNNAAKWTIAGVGVVLDVEKGDLVEKFKV